MVILWLFTFVFQSDLALAQFQLGTDQPLQFHNQPLPQIEEPSFLDRLTFASIKQSANPSTQRRPIGGPDSSTQSVWVRMFPLLSVPLGDPYPITQNGNLIRISSPGGLKVMSLNNQTKLGEAQQLDFDFSQPTLQIGDQTIPLQELWIVANNPEDLIELRWDIGLTWRGDKPAETATQVRGSLVVAPTLYRETRDNPERILWSVINIVSFDQYLTSVVPSEVIASWNQQTLRAQAIAARTYGMYQVLAARDSEQFWDVEPSTWYQSYQGVRFWVRNENRWRNIELPATTEAVLTTSGQMIFYRNSLIQAYFSANSGGITCRASECFGITNQPYLVQKNDAAGVKQQPGGTWGTRAQLTLKNITDVLKILGINPRKPVKRLAVLQKGPSGRVWRLKVQLTDGSSISLDNLQTRRMMHLYGPIRSFLYTLQKVSDGRQGIVGHGYGHAVGLSQWGAQILAKKGWNYDRILKFYYPGTEIKTLSF